MARRRRPGRETNHFYFARHHILYTSRNQIFASAQQRRAILDRPRTREKIARSPIRPGRNRSPTRIPDALEEKRHIQRIGLDRRIGSSNEQKSCGHQRLLRRHVCRTRTGTRR